MKNTMKFTMAMVILASLVVIPFVFAITATKPAQPFGGESMSNSAGVGMFSINGLNITTSGGNFSSLTFSVTSASNHWSAFIGNISTAIGLISTNSGELSSIFNFTVSASSLESVAATTTFNPNWANYKAVNKDVVDSALQLGLSAADSTFNMYNNTAFTFGGVTLNTTYLNDNGSSANSIWANGVATTASSGTAYTTNSGIENFIFLARVNGSKSCLTWANIDGKATKLVEGSGNCTNNGAATISAQFQMIVGVNETNSSADTEAGNKYTFFYVNP